MEDRTSSDSAFLTQPHVLHSPSYNRFQHHSSKSLFHNDELRAPLIVCDDQGKILAKREVNRVDTIHFALKDYFSTLVDTSYWKILLLMTVLYVFLWIFFAGWYYAMKNGE
jgi:hypothetical protein